MGLIICIACNHQREVTLIRRKRRRCRNCGANDPRVIRRKKWWRDGRDQEGISKEEAEKRTYAGLRWYADEKRHKTTWAVMNFRKVFGRYPPRGFEGTVKAAAPSATLFWWIDRQKAEYAKMQREQKNRREVG